MRTKELCEWTENEDGCWDAACGGKFEVIDGTPKNDKECEFDSGDGLPCNCLCKTRQLERELATMRDEVALNLLVKVYGVARSGLYRDDTESSIEAHPVMETIFNYLIAQGRISKD